MTATHCPYCALQCGMNLAPKAGNLMVAPRPEFPTNKGGLCAKGWTSASLLDSPERLTEPVIRRTKGGPLEAVSWDEAILEICRRIGEIQGDRGVNSIGVFDGGGLTNEKAYALGKFARVALRTANIDYNGRFCMSSAAAANLGAFGIDRGLPFPLEDIAATEAILLVGSNVAETMPPVMQYFEAQRRSGGSLIVVDPRKTPTAVTANLHLQATPGTDLALANGMLYIAIEEGLLDEQFIADRTTGFEAVRRAVASYWPDRVERMTGVPAAQLRLAVRKLSAAKSAMVLTSRGAEQHSKGVDTVLAFINLALALGKVGKPNCGYGCITGQGNGQGGREHGQKADQLPGYRRIDDPAARAHIASVWGIDEADLPGAGISAPELLGGIGTEKGIEGLIVMGSNPVVSAPNAGKIREKLASLKLLVVSDIFLTETAALADVVLPTAQWAEEEGTMTNLEGRVLLRRKATEPPAGVKTDLEALQLLAAGLGCGRFFSAAPSETFRELCRASEGGAADYSGITYERIVAEDGVFWPCPGPGHPGTPRLFLKRFATLDGRANFHAVRHRPAAEEPDDDFPLYLTTGRVMAQYQSGAQTRRVRELNATSPEPFVEIHPALAGRLGVAEGGVVSVQTRRGIAVLKVRQTASIREDTIFVPFHWSGPGSANLLTNPALDPTSKMPEFKICAARVVRMDDG